MQGGVVVVVLLLLVVIVSFVVAAPPACPGVKIEEYVINPSTWPNNTLGNPYYAAPLAVGLFYETQTDLLWALYNTPFALAAYNVTKLMNKTHPAWEAVFYDWQYYYPHVNASYLDNAQNLVVDSANDAIIITTSDPGNSTVWLSKKAFLAKHPEYVSNLPITRRLALNDNCRGITLDPANDGSVWVACTQFIYKISKQGQVIGKPFYLPAILDGQYYNQPAHLWDLTIDANNSILWGSADANDTFFHTFNILSNGTLEYNPTYKLDVGGESRGIIFDPIYQEVYAVRRLHGSPPWLAEGILLRTKAYEPGFAFGVFPMDNFPLFRANGMAKGDGLLFVAVTDPYPPHGDYNNTIHIYRYQHTGCQCRNNRDCDNTDQCFKGICVSANCSSCQVGTTTGLCAGSGVCVSSTNSSPYSTQLTFSGPSPTSELVPNNNPLLGLNVVFESLEEIPPWGGLPIQSISLLDIPFSVSGPFIGADSSQNFYVSTSTAFGNISFIFSLLPENGSASRTFGTVGFVQSADTTKWTLKVDNWPWLYKASTLLLRVRLLSNDGPFLSASSRPTTQEITTFTLTTASSTVTVNIFNFALGQNGQNVSVTPSFFTANTMLLFSFAYFGNSLTYDPDFGVLVTPSNSGGGDGTSTVLTIVLSVVIPVVIIPILLLVVVLVGIYIFTFYKRRAARAGVNSINTDSFEYAADAAADTI